MGYTVLVKYDHHGTGERSGSVSYGWPKPVRHRSPTDKIVVFCRKRTAERYVLRHNKRSGKDTTYSMGDKIPKTRQNEQDYYWVKR